eukprot:TRINITY_DN1106_c0_g1_i1.p1 TRINITY_DN1106_c0_g1~~TRINITY_DN1106_c0_g1_i1.p1  ORF type:complete len:135 (+),score=24.57 TRINITY_DN1106_c0_g1_i1:151-555(+)
MFEPTGISESEYTLIVFLNVFILIVGTVLDVLGLLLWLRKIQPNRCIGVRIKSMGDNRDVWFEVNEYVGKVLTLEGLLLVTFSLIYMILPFSFKFLGRGVVFLVIFIISMVGVTFLVVSRAKAFARPMMNSFEL